MGFNGIEQGFSGQIDTPSWELASEIDFTDESYFDFITSGPAAYGGATWGITNALAVTTGSARRPMTSSLGVRNDQKRRRNNGYANN